MSIRDYLPTDGPGYTDYPDNDIRTHRKIAWSLRWMGLLGLVLFTYIALQTGPVWMLGVAVAVYLICNQASSQLRIEALEWEVALQQRDRDV